MGPLIRDGTDSRGTKDTLVIHLEQRFFLCKKCGQWFEAPPLTAYQAVGLSKMEKCPHCAKWAIYQHTEARITPGISGASSYG